MRAALIVVCSATVGAIMLLAMCSRSSTHVSQTESRSTEPKLDAKVEDAAPLTLSEANYINTFARKHDMTVNQVMRWEFVLAQHNLSIRDYDQALTRISESADKALGYHVVRPKLNLETPLVEVGQQRPAQDSKITEDEKAVVKVLKAAGY